MSWKSLVRVAFLSQLLTGAAHAQVYNVCLKLPVTLADEVGMPNEIGTSGNWKARGIRVETLRYNGVPVLGFPANATADTGCFAFVPPTPATSPATVQIGLKSWGMLHDDNELRVHNDSGITSYYVGDFVVYGIGGSFDAVWPVEAKLLKTYAILAYAINEGFRGHFDDEVLRVWLHDGPGPGSSPCGCDDAESWGPCACSSNDQSHITITGGISAKKYLLTHEYGHRVLYGAISVNASTSYSFDVDGDPTTPDSGHGMRGLEWSSAAAMEGWANFVAADVWTSGEHSGGDPVGWLRYWGNGNHVIDVEAGQGGCAAEGGDSALNYRAKYADVCASAGWQQQIECSGGDCDGIGVELDWMRMWWDFHTDDDHVGGLPDHGQLQRYIEESGGWGIDTIWDDLKSGMYAVSNDIGVRFEEVANWNGVSEP